MSQNTAPPPNQHHQPETVSTANLQAFEDPPGGLPLDSPIVQARQQQQHGGRPARSANAPGRDVAKEG
jgi:hypothetical protein